MATHSSVLAWRIPWTEEPGGLQPTGSHRVDTTKRLTLSLSFHRAGKFHLGLVHYLQASLTINLDLNRIDP